MNKRKKLLMGILLIAMTVTMFVPGKAMAEGPKPDPADKKPAIIVSQEKVPTYKAGETHKWEMTIKNNAGKDLKNIVVSPDLGDDAEAWPFKTDYQKYESTIETLAKDETKTISFDLTQRDDVGTTRYTIPFVVSADDIETDVQKLYVNTTAKPQPQESGGTDNSAEADSPGAAGDVSNGDASYSGGGGSSTSVPRVIVTGFSTDPGEVRAGNDFTLTIHLKNTSKSTRVKNMLFDLAAPTEGNDEQTMAPAFLPTSGSSSVYLEGIKANGTADISITLNAKSDLLQKPYSIDLSMKYEDAEGAQIEASSGISIPVKQDARFELSDFEISPDTIAVGEEANVMCSLYNLGRIKLYNVKVRFEGNCIEKEEIFLGNVDSGATGSIDAMLEGSKAIQGPAKVTMTLSYEDESGNVSEVNKELELEVMEAVEDDMEMVDMIEEEKGFPVVPVVIIIVVIAAIAAALLLVKRRKKKQILNEEEELLYELDGPSEDEQQ